MVDEAPVLELRGITKRFPGVVANDSVDFDLRRGEVHALLGENGAGKSTLMNVLNGLYHPDEGEVLVKGKPIRLHSPKDAINHPEFFRRDQSDFDGSFVLPAVIPGTYSILALQDAWDLRWGEPGALTRYLAKSQALTVGSLMQRTVVLPEAIEVQPR